MDCITIEGDQINRKGALTGGYRDTKTSRLAMMNTIRGAEKKKAELEESVQKIKADILAVDTLLNRYAIRLIDLI
jgi:structural maintenance of chromosome 3 (chondroitin sulfate proteoglycan 6)